ncbi:MAG: hypothetical protein JWM16_3852 [Verrucomicrobiales bacterium]|nr:hypothetical protein [Verrucomicrobiales bacterium]
MRLFEVAGLKRGSLKPRLIVGIRYRLRFVIDLTKVLAMVRFADLPELLEEGWQQLNEKGLESRGQALGRALFDSGVEGIMVPSARVVGAMNLVVFPENLLKSTQQTVLEQADLRAWLKES